LGFYPQHVRIVLSSFLFCLGSPEEMNCLSYWFGCLSNHASFYFKLSRKALVTLQIHPFWHPDATPDYFYL